jgi:hypothetical protein
MRGDSHRPDKNKVVSLIKKRRQKRKDPFHWLRLIQLVGVLSAFLLLYKGGEALIHLNESYIEKTLIPSTKVSAVESPEAKQFAIDTSQEFLMRDWISLPKGSHFQLTAPAVVGEIKNEGQYRGRVDVHVAGLIFGKERRFIVEVPIEYIAGKKVYRLYGTPAVKEEKAK